MLLPTDSTNSQRSNLVSSEYEALKRWGLDTVKNTSNEEKIILGQHENKEENIIKVNQDQNNEKGETKK